MPPPTSNPAPDPASDLAEIRARHLAQSREAQALLLDLMRAAAERAHQALAEPEPAPDPDTPQPRHVDHILEVARLNRGLHQAMAFEARTAQGDPANDPARRRTWRVAASPAVAADRRRDLVRYPLHQAVRAEGAPGTPQRLRELDEHLDDILADDPDQTIEAGDILDRIAEHHAISIDPRHLSDEILGMENPRPIPPHILNRVLRRNL